MLLFNDRDSAAAAGDDNLVCIGEGADSFYFHNVNGLGGSNHTAEAKSCVLLHIIALLYFHFGILFGHISANHLCGLVKCLVIGVYRYLGQNGADRFGNASV